MKKLTLIAAILLLTLTSCEKIHKTIDECPNDPNKTKPGYCGCGNEDRYDIVTGQYQCADPKDLCPNDPNKKEPGICGCGRSDEDLDRNGLADCVDEKIDLCPDDPNKKFPGACGCNAIDIIGSDGSVTCREDKIDLCPDDPNKTKPGICGCGESDDIEPETGVPKCIFDQIDLCPDDPEKKFPGVCGCGVPDIDKNGNEIMDCNEIEYDLCPFDPDKTQPGECGCGMKELVLNEDSTPICNTDGLDLCPDDPDKTTPGICGCGLSDMDMDDDTIPDCIQDNTEEDYCPDDDNKVLPGVCGCGVSDSIIDVMTGAPVCISDLIDLCPDDENKTRPGICGCGESDESDMDEDNYPDCIDVCPENPLKTISTGICGCDAPDSDENVTDADGDGIPNCLDACPENPYKSKSDSCECNAILYKVQDSDTGLCAQIISNAKEFIDFRDQWNNGTINSSQSAKVFLVVDDINLGEVLSRDDAANWVGIGTEDHPFDAIITGYQLNHNVGNPISISAVISTGHLTEKLILGNAESSNLALFGYTKAARISNLNVKLSFLGNDHVAGLVANATESSISNVEYSEGTIKGSTYVAGLAAEMIGSSAKNIIIRNSSVSIVADDAFSGGITASAENSQISNAIVYSKIKGGSNTGGIAGLLKTSTLSSAGTEGTVTGTTNTGGIAGEITAHSAILNVYTTAHITCLEAPCASLIATISDFSTVKNAYTTGIISNEIQETSDAPTTPKSPIDEDDPEDPEDPETGESEHDNAITVPAAALIASFLTTDNVIDKLYYWNLFDVPAMPQNAIDTKYVSEPAAFNYNALIPMLSAPSRRLIDTLNDNLTCFGDNSCTLEGTTTLNWIAGSRLISRPNNTQMTVTLPTLKF